MLPGGGGCGDYPSLEFGLQSTAVVCDYEAIDWQGIWIPLFT